MTQDPSVCREEHTVYDAVRIMNREDCGVVPVIDAEERCIGILTDRDICMKIVLDHLDPEDTQVSEMMSGHVNTCKPDDPIESVIALMEKEQIRRVPVVDEQERIIGIISEGDIAKSDAKDKVSELVEAIVK
jgi:CBS domain-containing protein